MSSNDYDNVDDHDPSCINSKWQEHSMIDYKSQYEWDHREGSGKQSHVRADALLFIGALRL